MFRCHRSFYQISFRIQNYTVYSSVISWYGMGSDGSLFLLLQSDDAAFDGEAPLEEETLKKYSKDSLTTAEVSHALTLTVVYGVSLVYHLPYLVTKFRSFSNRVTALELWLYTGFQNYLRLGRFRVITALTSVAYSTHYSSAVPLVLCLSVCLQSFATDIGSL